MKLTNDQENASSNGVKINGFKSHSSTLLVRILYLQSTISNTRKCVSSNLQTPKSGLKNEAQPSFF